MKELRVGVVGVGHLGQHHARILSGIPGVKLVGVVDADPERARIIAERYGTKAVTDYRDLIGAVDAASIAVPTTMHREVACAFLDRGVSCLVEKPLASTLAEAEAIASLAARRRVTLQVGHIERFNPALKALETTPARSPKFIAAERLGMYTFRSTDIGVVLDLMIHDIDLVLSMVDAEPVDVSAVGVSVFGGHEDIANARIAFSDGCVATLTASRVSYQTVRRMRVFDTGGYITLDLAAREGTRVRPSEFLKNGDLALDRIDRADASQVRKHVFGTLLDVEQIQPANDGEPLAAELREFIAAVRGEVHPRVDGAAGLRAMALAVRVLESLDTHSWDGLPEGVKGPHLRLEPGSGINPPHFPMASQANAASRLAAKKSRS